MIRTTLHRALVALVITSSALTASSLVVKPLATPDASLPVIQWLDNAETHYWDTAPLFTLGDSKDAGAKGWVALTESHLLLRVEVTDQDPVYNSVNQDIWQNDGLQIAIDGRGNGTDGMDPGKSGAFGPDDMALGLAFTATGPQGWLFVSDNKDLKRGALPADWFSIVQDPATNRTTYTLSVPWAALVTKPGVNPVFGLAVQLNDTHSDGREQTRFYYGRGADGNPRPGLHQKLVYGVPAKPYAAASIVQTTIWSPQDPAIAQVAVYQPAGKTFLAKIGSNEATIPVTDLPGWQRWEVGFPASGVNAPASIVQRPASGEGKSMLKFTPTVAEQVYEGFLSQLDALLETSPHPLFTRHIQSVKSLTMTEWARLGVYRASDPLSARETLERIQSMARGFAGDAGQWESYLNGKRSLVLAYKSPHDGTLQYYLFCVPKDWDPEKAYPFFFELHGAGDNNPLSGVTAKVGITENAPNLHGYSAPKVFAEIQRNGYWCEPFGRGNLGYRDIGETDIFEAYDDVHAHFKIDPDRRYLYGFSMGGGGTWRIGIRTPDRWAAMAIFSGGLWREPESLGLVNNIKHLPIRIWCGEADALFAQVPLMKAELAEAGITPVVVTAPGVGHQYLAEVQEAGLNWLQQFTRKQPKSFEFRTDSETLNSAWGITLGLNPVLSGVPRCDCSIDGQVVTLNSEGASSVEVLPGIGGLGLSGDFKLIWNGQEVYSGPVQPLLLKSGQATPFDPTQRRRHR